MLTASQENARALASLTGLSEEEAANKLSFRVRLTGEGALAEAFSKYLAAVAGLTIEIVSDGEAHLAVAVNGAPAGTAPDVLYLTIGGDALVVSDTPISLDHASGAPPDIALRVAACFAAGAIIKRAVGDAIAASPLPLTVEFAKLGITHAIASTPLQFNDTVLAGAGGVASGFLWALEGAATAGELDVADPKAVAPGNFNRHLHFFAGDEDKPKAPLICERADIPTLNLRPFVGTVHELVKQRGRVKRVIVTVDSRKVRRSIQQELPVEVLDASTTDVTGVVIHSHAQPLDGACLACLYKHIPLEDERARSVAEGLGISLEEAKQDIIDQALAAKLAGLHSLDEGALMGTALSSQYKALCGAGALKTSAGKQALAPFAFVSVLAGALLVLELMRFESNATARTQSNYMQLNPWFQPHGRARTFAQKEPDCEFCSKSEALEAMQAVWPEPFGLSVDEAQTTHACA